MLSKENVTDDEKKYINKYIKTALIIASAIYLLASVMCYFSICFVNGNSMNPTYNDGDILFGIKNTIFSGDYKKGDIISFDSPTEPGKKLIKRIIATSGDHIEITENNVYVNGTKLDENYIIEDKNNTDYSISLTLKKDEIFVMGDNRTVSVDSRIFGVIKIKDVAAKMIFIL